jgi:hypothetical protein
MRRVAVAILKALAITVAALFALGVMLTGVGVFFGSSKVRTLFDESANALEGSTDSGTRTQRRHAPDDAGF